MSMAQVRLAHDNRVIELLQEAIAKHPTLKAGAPEVHWWDDDGVPADFVGYLVSRDLHDFDCLTPGAKRALKLDDMNLPTDDTPDWTLVNYISGNWVEELEDVCETPAVFWIPLAWLLDEFRCYVITTVGVAVPDTILVVAE